MQETQTRREVIMKNEENKERQMERQGRRDNKRKERKVSMKRKQGKDAI